MASQEENKRKAGEAAADYVQSGMKVGLGTGSTVYWTIRKLANRVQEGLDIACIATSQQTEQLAHEWHIPMTTFRESPSLDITIDGADELTDNLDLIKGGGGALLREKLVALASKEMIVVADASKHVKQLGRFLVPVEVVPFAFELTTRRIEQLGAKTKLRTKGETKYITDNGNYILDCDFGLITKPGDLHDKLKDIHGVVDSGLFINIATRAIVAGESDIHILEK